jgi:23S rRNA (guanosine2251-2'-O)-methyltransferase
MKIGVILDNIRSVHNVGSIFRTADGVGVEKLYLCGITPSPIDRLKTVRADFAKVALGAEEYVPWELVPTTEDAIARAKSEGYIICALEQAENSIPYYSLRVAGAGDGNDSDAKIAIVLGTEVDGLSPEILQLADHILEIPMRGDVVAHSGHPKNDGHGKESLNVAVAFGIVAFGLRYAKK